MTFFQFNMSKNKYYSLNRILCVDIYVLLLTLVSLMRRPTVELYIYLISVCPTIMKK